MADFKIDFIHPTTLETNSYNIERNMNWSSKMNGPSGFTISALGIAAADEIDLGYIVKVYRNNELEFTGMITGRKLTDETATFKGVDIAGMLARRILNRYKPDAGEATADIKSVLNGFSLDGGISISADSFLVTSLTTTTWEWEWDSYDGWISHMAERCLATDGVSYKYRWWIQPDGELHFEPEKTGKVHDFTQSDESVTKNITIDEDINNTFNSFTLRGTEAYAMPPDGDAWTEQDIEGWYAAGAGGVIMDNWDLSGITPQIGNKSIQYEYDNNPGGSSLAIVSRSLLFLENYLNLEALESISFWVYHISGFSDARYFQLVDGDGDTVELDISWTIDTWVLNTLDDFTGFGGSGQFSSETGTFDWTRVSEFRFLDGPAGNIHWKFNVDAIQFVVAETFNGVSDTDSIAEFGQIDTAEAQRNINSKAILTALGTNYLNHYKDKSTRSAISLEGYWKIRVNDVIRFIKRNTLYELPVSSVRHFLKQDSSESTQLTMGNPRFEIVDIYKKYGQQVRYGLRNIQDRLIIKV